MELDETEVPRSPEGETLSLTLEDGELGPDPNDPPEDQRANMPADTPPLTFNDEPQVRALKSAQFSPDRGLTDPLLDSGDFLLKYWGLRIAGEEDNTPDERPPMRLGIPIGMGDVSVRQFLGHVMEGTPLPLPAEWDLSPNFSPVGGEFPQKPLTTVLRIESLGLTEYLLTITDKDTRPWKILIDNPMVLLQIERERWHLQGDGLVSNLVRKGLPFQILYPSRQADAIFYPHNGPVIHPEGREPTRVDYLTYCLDVAQFFKLYPHAHVAALCSGSILWRIAIDVLPIPAEHHLIRPFHPCCCRERVIQGTRYWTPQISAVDEEIIVGMYKWPSKSNQSTANPFINKF